MKTVFLAVGCALVILVACSKDDFQTKPTVDIKDVNSKVIPVGQGMSVTLKVTDKEGDVDSMVYIYKTRLNRIKATTIRDSILLPIPKFPKTQSVEFMLNLGFQEHLLSASPARRDPITRKLESDTLDFKFVVKDAKGNKSDTAFLRNIVVQRDSL
jgi:hypothetical protein